MWPAIIGAVGSLAGAGINAASSSSAADTAYGRQKALMALQQQYAVENWNREVNYNDPKEQMKRLKSAGLNPNLIYGSGAAGLEAPSTAAPTAPSAPMQATTPGNFGSAVSDAVQAAVGIAQAKKAGAETIGQKIENEFNLKTLNERIASVGKQNKWTDEQIRKTSNEADNLVQQWNLLTGQINALSTDREIRQKELAQMDERFQKEMRALDDQHNLSHEEYRRLLNTYDDFVRMMKNNADKSEWDAKIQELTYNIESRYAETEKNLGMVGQIIGLLLRAFGK